MKQLHNVIPTNRPAQWSMKVHYEKSLPGVGIMHGPGLNHGMGQRSSFLHILYYMQPTARPTAPITGAVPVLWP